MSETVKQDIRNRRSFQLVAETRDGLG